MKLRLTGFVDVLACASLVSGCVVGPAYHAPPPPFATAYHSNPALASRSPRPAPPLETWWSGFNDPELVSLVTRALDQNLDIAQADARLTQARARLKAAGAALLPQGQLTGQAAYTHLSISSPTGRVESAFRGFSRDQSIYDAGAAASWEPDLFGGLTRGRQAARADFQGSQAARAGARLSVAAQTADAYVLVRTFQARLAVVEEQVRTERRLVALTELQFSRGVAARLEVDQARGVLADVEAQAPQLRAALEAELDALEVLVGVTPGSLRAELSDAKPIPAPPGVETAGGPSALVRRRPDIIAAERALAASSARIGEALADYYPKVTLSGVVGVEASGAAHLFTGAAFQPQGLIGLRWRLFDFGRVDAEVAGSRGAQAEALAAYRQSVLKATADVESSLTALVERERQARLLGGGELSLLRARTTAQAAYGAGRVSLIEVLDADTRLLATRDQKLVAMSEAARAAIASYKALGGGWS